MVGVSKFRPSGNDRAALAAHDSLEQEVFRATNIV